MKNIFLQLLTAVLLPVTALAETITFDKMESGQQPVGWQCGVTGNGSPRWSVEADKSAASKPKVLKQSGAGTYPWCVMKDVSITDGYVEVKFKPLSGKEDQAGGLVWRWKNGNNYYIARANALEKNVTIYHTINGSRQALQSVNIKVAQNQWHTLRVDFQGQHYVVTFDGRRAMGGDDDSLSDPGTVGVWTKADSVTLFDDFSYAGK